MITINQNRNALAEYYAKKDREEAERRAAAEAERARIEAERERKKAEEYEKLKQATKEHKETMLRISRIWEKVSEVKEIRFNVESGKVAMLPNPSKNGQRSEILEAMRRGDGVINIPSVLVKGGELDLFAFTHTDGTLQDGAGVLRNLPKYSKQIVEIEDPPFKVPEGVHIYTLWGSLNHAYALWDGKLILCCKSDGSEAMNSGEGFKAKTARLAAEEAARKAEEERIRQEEAAKAEAARQQENMQKLAAIPQSAFEKLMSLVSK